MGLILFYICIFVHLPQDNSKNSKKCSFLQRALDSYDTYSVIIVINISGGGVFV